MKEFTYKICTERSELFEPNILICYSIEFNRDISVSKLKTAVVNAWKANESCYSKIVIDTDGTAGYMPVPVCQNNFMVEDSDAEIFSIIKREEKKVFRIFNGEMMRVFFFPKGCKNSRLLILAHHLVGDGKSILFFLEDVMNSLAGKTLTYKKMMEVNPAELPKKSRLKKITQSYLESVNKKWEKKKRVFTYDDYYCLYKHYWKDRESETQVEDFTSDEVTALLSLTRKHKISLTTLLSVMLLKNCKLEKGKYKTGFAVDTRNKSDKCMSNQITGFNVAMAYNTKKDLWKNAEKFHKLLTGNLSDQRQRFFTHHFVSSVSPTLYDSTFFSWFGLYQNALSYKMADMFGYTKKSKNVLGISNLNQLPIPHQYGDYEIIKCVFIPPAITYNPKVIGIVTDSGGMHIAFHEMKVQGIEPENSFFKQAVKEIHNLAASVSA